MRVSKKLEPTSIPPPAARTGLAEELKTLSTRRHRHFTATVPRSSRRARPQGEAAISPMSDAAAFPPLPFLRRGGVARAGHVALVATHPAYLFSLSTKEKARAHRSCRPLCQLADCLPRLCHVVDLSPRRRPRRHAGGHRLREGG